MPTQIHSALQFHFPEIENRTTITLKKTLQVVNDGKEHPLPPDQGDFPYFYNGAQRIVPMNHENEALYLNFANSNQFAPVAIKVLSGGINAITGEKESEATYTTLRNNDENGAGQNYMLVPGQPWLDGFMSKDNAVRQFIAVNLGQGKSIEEKLEGTLRGGLQIMVIPTKKAIVEKKTAEFHEQQRLAKEAREQERQAILQQKIAAVKSLEDSIKEKEDMLALIRQESLPEAEITKLEIELERNKKILVVRKEHLARMQENVHAPLRIHAQKEMAALDSIDDGADDLRFEEDAFEGFEALSMMENKSQDLSAVPEFHRGAKPSTSSASIFGSLTKLLPTFKMGLGGGGKIKQSIYVSTTPIADFDPTQARYMDLDLINLQQFAVLNGSAIPPREPTAQEYTNAGGLWFDLLAAEAAVKVSEQSRLAALENQGTLSALPVENEMTVPDAQVVQISGVHRFVSNAFSLLPSFFRTTTPTSSASTTPAATAEQVESAANSSPAPSL